MNHLFALVFALFIGLVCAEGEQSVSQKTPARKLGLLFGNRNSNSSGSGSRASYKQVLQLDLINADTDKKVLTLTDGMVIESTSAPSFNIQATLLSNSGFSTKSVRFGYQSNSRYVLDNASPFTFCTYDSRNKYTKCSALTYGNHVVTATPYSRTSARGTTGPSIRIAFSIVKPKPPTAAPVKPPTKAPTRSPTNSPVKPPTKAPTRSPTLSPVKAPTRSPTNAPVKPPTKAPTRSPTLAPVKPPTKAPTRSPTTAPVKPPTKAPTRSPTLAPVKPPTKAPFPAPTKAPVPAPTKAPVPAPTKAPAKAPTKAPTKTPVSPVATAPIPAPVPSQYTIQLDLTYITSASDRVTFEDAAKRWQQVITGDLPSYGGQYMPARSDGCTWPSQIDDLYICAQFDAIDGPSGVLGFAGPEYIRSGGLPVSGIMVFDQDDITMLKSNGGGGFVSTILHEMGHVIGIGPLWDNKSLTNVAPECDYVGPNANREYTAISGCSSVPIERQGGEGTACVHWDEECMGHELMTGYLDGSVASPLSRITVGALQDLGYQVDYTKADVFGRNNLSCTCNLRKKTRSLSDLAHGQVVSLGQSSSRRPRRRLSAAAQAKAVEAGLEFLASNAVAHAKAEEQHHDHGGVEYVADKFVSVMVADGGEVFGVIVRREN